MRSAISSTRLILCSDRRWLAFAVEMDEEEDNSQPSQFSVNSFSSSEETAVEPPPVYNTYNHGIDEGQREVDHKRSSSPPPSPIYNPPRHPTSIFSFPTPTAYAAKTRVTVSSEKPICCR